MDPPPPKWRTALREAPELLALALGLLLRLAMHGTYHPVWGYDWQSHYVYIRHIAVHHALPPLSGSRAFYHPPLFYWLAGWMERHGATAGALQWISILASCLTLVVLYLGLKRHLRDRRLARTVALALAAVLPASVHVAGMVTNESLQILLATIAILLIAETFAAQGRARLLLALPLGLAVAGALLTKVSSAVLVAVILLGIFAEWMWLAGDRATKLRAIAPLLAAVTLACALALPAYLRTAATGGPLTPTGYDRNASAAARAVEDLPLLRRRSLGYAFGLGSADLFTKPHWPTSAQPTPRFWPILFASTFADYYGYQFAGPPDYGDPPVPGPREPLGTRSLHFMQASLIAGLPIALLTIAAFLVSAAWLFRRRDLAKLLPLLAPLLAILGQLYFAIKLPYDDQGVVKGAYVLFASAPLCALFGLAVAWLWARPKLRVLAFLQIAALLVLATHDLHARRVILRTGDPSVQYFQGYGMGRIF